jgi:pyruvate/2-oxoglutarate/acetoin dehydrogenase E1 component
MSQTSTFADASRAVLEELALVDSSVLMLGETVGLSASAVPSLNVPIADRAAAGVASGLALAGRKVVMQLADTSRIPAIAEVLTELGAAAASGEFSPTLVVRVPYGREADALDLPIGAWFVDAPGVRVICAAAPDVGAGLLRTALSAPGVTLLLEPRSTEGARSERHVGAVPLSARLLKTGRHVTLVAWGPSLAATIAAADQLSAEGIEADVIDLVSLSPLDVSLIGERVRATGRLVVVHPDDPVVARRVREVAVESAFLYLEAPLADVAAVRDQVLAAARGAVHY